MTVKHQGGRGRRSPNKHETVTVSLPPHLKAALDAAVTPEVSRSEVVARLIAQHLRPQAAQAEAQVKAPRKAKKAPAAPQPERKPRPSRAKSTPALPPATPTDALAPAGIERPQFTGRAAELYQRLLAGAELADNDPTFMVVMDGKAMGTVPRATAQRLLAIDGLLVQVALGRWALAGQES